MSRLLTTALVSVALTVVSADGYAETPLECAPTESVDKYRLLRQLSIDLLDRIPTIDEYDAIESLDVIDEATITALLNSEEYFDQVRDYHRSVLWAGLDDAVDLAPAVRRLRRLNTTGNWRIPNNRRRYRGNNTVECLDQLQTDFTAGGRPIPISTFNDPACTNGVCQQEGYVMVVPYWDPATPIKVCAFDAQEQETGTNGAACNSASTQVGCGCGPNLEHCMPPPRDFGQAVIRTALMEEAPRIFESVIREGRSYFEGFTTKKSVINGPLAHFYTSLSGGEETPIRTNNLVSYATMSGDVPDLSFFDTTWRSIERSDVHAGVLTTAGFHLRFPSNRSRTNRFYSAFRCEPFVPSADGLPPETSEIPNPNLRERDGCSTCHVTLERAAAHWGQWRTSGQFGYMSTAEVDYSGPRAECLGCVDGGKACNSFCRTYFFTGQTTTHPDELAAWEGFPLARGWLSAEEAAQIDVGPSGLITAEEDRDRISSCTARTLAQHLLGRELTESETLTWLPDLTASFAASGYKFTELLKAVITDARYRRLR